jgi:hypothetical protein
MQRGDRVVVVASVYVKAGDATIGQCGESLAPINFAQRRDAWLVRLDSGERGVYFESELEIVTRESAMVDRHRRGMTVDVDESPEVKRGRGRPRKE